MGNIGQQKVNDNYNVVILIILMFFCSGKFVMEQINNFFSIPQNKKILFDQVKNIWTGYQLKKILQNDIFKYLL